MLPQEVQQEGQAFISWISLFQLSRPVTSLADLSDGAALFDVLACVLVSLVSFRGTLLTLGLATKSIFATRHGLKVQTTG